MSFLNIHKSSHPLLFLAPMEDVTDSSFRRLCKEYGADIVVSEFISTEGIIRKTEHFGKKMNFLPEERPFGIQLFGNDEISLTSAIQRIIPLAPDFIDLNFGCPVKKIVSKGCGAALLNDIALMEKLTLAAVNASHIPVTVKTRTGWDAKTRNILEIVLRLQNTGISAITIHGRTKAQMYHGEADWAIIGEVKNHPQVFIPVIGNGDITSAEVAGSLFAQYKTDGLMIGRAAFGNPFIFKQIKDYFAGRQATETDVEERVNACRRHFELSEQWKGVEKTIYEIRKHYAGYFKFLPDFRQFKQDLMLATNKEAVFEIFTKISAFYSGYHTPVDSSGA